MEFDRSDYERQFAEPDDDDPEREQWSAAIRARRRDFSMSGHYRAVQAGSSETLRCGNCRRPVANLRLTPGSLADAGVWLSLLCPSCSSEAVIGVGLTGDGEAA